MTIPQVNISEVDGRLGVLPAGIDPLTIIGTATSGAIDTPAAFARTQDVVTEFTAGNLVRAAAYAIAVFNRPVVLVRSTANVLATEDAIDATGVTGTSVVTAQADDANDDYQLYFEVITGGTIGTAGIEFVYSLDGGRTKSPKQALGTATTFDFPGTGGAGFDFAAGTLVAGDVATMRVHGPNYDSASLTTSLTALKNSTHKGDIILLAGPLDGTTFDTVETQIAGFYTIGKPRVWIGNFRMPDDGETEAAYKTAFDAAFSGKSSTVGGLCAGACELTDGIDGRKYLRPISWRVAAHEANVSEEVHIADPNLGSATGVSIRDDLGNPKHHDELINPGLDDSRATTLRTWNEFEGVYVTKSRIFSAAGSDFQLVPHRRVLNIAREIAGAYFARRLNKPVVVSASTGFLLETEAAEIEGGCEKVLAGALLAKPKASGGGFPKGAFVSLSRTDNVLSTKTLTVQIRVVPLGYPEAVTIEIGFFNPALQTVTV